MSRSATPVLEILALFLVVYAIQIAVSVVGGSGLYGSLFVLSAPLEAEPWTLVTSVYAHSSESHLVANSLGLVLFGWPIARATSRIRFHVYFVATGAIAGASHIVAGQYLPPEAGVGGSAVLGASGAVFALMGYLVASNRLSSGLANRLEVPFWAAVTIVVVLAVAITVATGSDGAALVAHFTGFLVGVAAGRAKLL